MESEYYPNSKNVVTIIWGSKVMKNIVKSAAVAASVIALSAGVTSAQADTTVDKIGAVLQTYEKALNGSDTNTVMTLYAPDGVFMPQHSPSSVGSEAIRAAYEGVFRAIKLEVEFEVKEIVQVAPDWAFVRTNSAGFQTVNATGARGPEANQELFIFHKDVGGNWKIARYCFSTTNPPRQ